MPCFRPWQMPRKDSQGRRWTDLGDVTVPCRQCAGCRVDHARQWGLRCSHESQGYEASSFLTLTYSNANYPDNGSVNVRDLQLFQKRVRHFRKPVRIRFFSCGEYSPSTWRAHYHVLGFGLHFADRIMHAKSKSGFPVYTSDELSELWPHGHAYIGDLTYESCAYTARYSMKKVNGKKALDHYRRINPVTGEAVQLRPEFITMSRRPGIGADWFKQFGSDCFPSDYLILNGSKVPVPSFYLRQLAARPGGDLSELMIKTRRKERGRVHADNNTPERLAVREEVAERRFARLMRSFEESM